MNTRVGGSDYLSLSIDNYGGACAMVEHLVQCGHRRIAFVAGPPNNFDADERLRGYRDALAKQRPKQAPQVLQGDFSEESGYRAGLDVSRLDPRPDAVFAANDMMAIGCLFALKEAGLDVPGDIALAGFDDIPIARFVSPPLTTVRVRIADLGAQALERLASVIDGRSQPRLARELECSLVARQSSGARPHADTS